MGHKSVEDKKEVILTIRFVIGLVYTWTFVEYRGRKYIRNNRIKTAS